MKKRILSLALAAVMFGSLSIAYAAAAPAVKLPIPYDPAVSDGALTAAPPSDPSTADQRLAAVTALVKGVLELDTERYTSFYGDLNEGMLIPSWQLNWIGDNENLYITATEEGKVLNYTHNTYASSPSRPGSLFAPVFPQGDKDQARAAAQAFVDRVLTEGESVVLTDAGGDRLGATSFQFSGSLLINGLPAGLTCSVRVNCADNSVLSFYRDDLLRNGVMGDIPSPVPQVGAEEAAQTLRGTLALKLEYVLDEDDPTHAVLRYLPVYGHEYYVDAATGKLVDLTELYQSVNRNGGVSGGSGATGDMNIESSEAPAPTEAPQLTEAELSGAALLEGVLDKDALDKAARALTALGLDPYTLSSAGYTVSREDDGAVSATLRYGRQVDGRSWRRTVVLDAKSGELQRVYSSAWLGDENAHRTVTAEAAQKAAENFLAAQCPELLAASELYTSYDALSSKWSVSHTFQYAQKVNGYFLPANCVSVGIDATDGSVSDYDVSFDTTVRFDSAEGIITMDQAIDAWLNTYATTLSYVQVPTAVDYSDPVYAHLEGWGVRYLNKLVLGYSLQRDGWCSGIDAQSAEPVMLNTASSYELTYDDISGHWAEAQVLRLARYGVGYSGGSFRPNDSLTQLDMIALLVSATGMRFYDENDKQADRLYEIAFSYGILDRAERDDELVLTRMDAVKLLLNALGYGPVAQLQGIYRTSFADDADIPAESYGYAALSQGLDIIHGDEGRFLPYRAATRLEGALMLYNVMAR